jgi:type II secretion system protein H
MSQQGRDSGFTLIEVLVTISLLSVMMAIAVTGWSSWTKSSEHSGTASEVESTLRQTQQRAVTEGRAMCVKFDVGADTYAVYTGACGAANVQVLGPLTTAADDVHLASPSFTGQSGTTSTDVTFYARGSASPGTVKVTRTGESKVYTLQVEGLTGRVSIS